MRSKERQARRDAYRDYCRERIPENSANAQNVFTPYELCYDIVRKLDSKTRNLAKKKFLVLNLEFAEILIHDFGVSPGRISFWTDCDEKRKFCQLMYKGVLHKKIELNKEGVIEMTKEAKKMKNSNKFDVVIGNPPYQPNVKKSNGDGSRHTLWDKFVVLSFEILKDKGYLCMVHPSKWRKPEDNLLDLMKNKQLLYLEIHNKRDGKKIFGAITRYDWYVLRNTISTNSDKTVIKDEKGKIFETCLYCMPFIPNYDFDLVDSIIAKDGEKTCKVLYSRSEYGMDKSWMHQTKTKRYKHPCIVSTGRKGVRWAYSSKRGNFFGISKVIFGESDIIGSAVIDNKGEYGITSAAMGIPISSKKEGLRIKKALESKKFNSLLKSMRWSNFRIDWRMFKYFRKDFWKEFV